jgi:O-succinylbenzoate synthase
MLKLEDKDYTLDFKFEAGTSRGVMTTHEVIFIKIYQSDDPSVFGLGEAAPLKNLSSERLDDVREAIAKIKAVIAKVVMPTTELDCFKLVKELCPDSLPSLRTALETAFLDLMGGGRRMIFDNDFSKGKASIPINGLIWMADAGLMKSRIQEKLAEGYDCIKMKIGAIDFEQELKLLEMLRDSSMELTIRVDANGAFPTNEALAKLKALEPFGIHSIEQPIMAGQPEAMQIICKRSPIPIALDEELIGVNGKTEKAQLLDLVKPQYIILKPTFVGGFASTLEWIALAEERKIGWWLTSALESNVTLNAIAQFAGRYPNNGHQGLGTGQLYHNNVSSPLEIRQASLHYNLELAWDSVFS